MTQDHEELERENARLSAELERCQTLMENLGHPMGFYDREGVLLMMNRAAAENLGGVPADFLGRSMEEFIPGAAAEYMGRLRRVFETNQSQDYEDAFTLASGREVIFESRYRPVPGPEGKALGVQIISLEVTEKKRALAAEQAARLTYETMIKASPDAVIGTDRKGLLTLASHRAVRMFGYASASEMIGLDIRRLASEHEMDRLRGNVERILKHGVSMDQEFVLLKKDGTRFFGQVSGALIRDGAGRIQGFMTVAKDVTSRVTAEAELKRERDRAQMYLDLAGVMFVALDERGRVSMVNRRGEEMLEAKAADILGRDWFENFIPAEQRAEVAGVFARLLKGELTPAEYFANEIVTATGRRRLIAWHNTPARDEDGRVQGIIGSGEDITERMQAQRELMRSEARFRAVFETAQDAIFIKDREGRYVLVNPALEMLMGVDAAELVGRTSQEHQLGATEIFSQPPDAEVLAGRALTAETSALVKGRERVFHVVKTPLGDEEGRVTGLCCMARDISELTQLGRQLRQARKMEAIGTLAGGIAHDFNNILGIIIGNAELALADVPDWNPVWLNLSEIKTASLRAKDVIRQLLSFTRETDQEKRVTELGPIVREAMSLLRASIPAAVEMRAEIGEDVPPVLADPTQIHQILLNLCSNAAQAMERGGVLRVSLARVEEGGEKTRGALLGVEDNGPGMTPEVLERIFDPYFTTKEVGRGSGMGLAVVHGIVQNHGAEISAWSRPGQGSRFEVFFPAAQDRPRAQEAPRPAAGQGRGRGESILFVDDEEALARLGEAALGQVGYRVTAFTDPAAALAAFEREPEGFDLLVTDMSMPGMSGKQLAARVKKLRPNLPVAMCTGYSDQIDEAQARALGLGLLLQKPVRLDDLALSVRRLLDG